MEMPDAEQEAAKWGPAVAGGSEHWGGFELAESATARLAALRLDTLGDVYAVDPTVAPEVAAHFEEFTRSAEGVMLQDPKPAGTTVADALRASAKETGATPKGREYEVSSAEQV